MCTGLKNRSIAFDREVNVAWASNCMNYMIEKEGNKKKNNFNSYKLFERFVKASALLCANNAASIRVHYFYRVHNVNSP